VFLAYTAHELDSQQGNRKMLALRTVRVPSLEHGPRIFITGGGSGVLFIHV
jgi:hypothetical protein